MKQQLNRYTFTAWAFLVAGVPIAAVAYFILDVVWLTAMGLALVIIGLLLFGLARSLPRLSPEFARLLFSTSADNLAILFEELAVKTQAVYLPPDFTGGRGRALIPLSGRPDITNLKTRLPNRLIVHYGNNPQDLGLLVNTPGTPALASINITLEENAEVVGAALSALFSGTLDMADSTIVYNKDNAVKITFEKLRYEHQNDRTFQVLGSVPASIAATFVAAAWQHPTVIISESKKGRRYEVVLELLVV